MLDLEPIKKRLAARTQGEWHWSDFKNSALENGKPPRELWADSGELVLYSMAYMGEDSAIEFYDEKSSDLEVIANAPMDIEAAIVEIEKLRGIVAAVAEDTPARAERVEIWDACPYCTVCFRLDRKSPLRAKDHDQDCHWRRAKEYLES